MPSVIARKVDEETYYRLKRIMAELRCNTWAELLRKLVEVYEKWKKQ
jgi:hypothetical protein